MNKKLVSAIAAIVVLLNAVLVATYAEVSVGVKPGDWIEYNNQVTSKVTLFPVVNVTWARMDIVDVQGKDINLAVASKLYNGSWLNETVHLNLEAGQLADDFIIPANLSSDDMFFDKGQGNMTISGVEERTYAGDTRTVVSGTYAGDTIMVAGGTAQTAHYLTTYYWDRATGVLVEGNSSYNFTSVRANFTMYTIVDKTNMWQPQIFGLDPTVFYVLIIAVAVILVIAVFFVIRRKK